jgi:hypothetical protein
MLPVPLADVPRIALPAPLPSPHAPGPAHGDATDALALEPLPLGPPGAHRIHVQREPLSTLWLGAFESGGSRDGEVSCGPLAAVQLLSPVRWETLGLREGRAELVISDGWIDGETCGVTLVRRTTVEPLELVPGLLYAFLACSDDCEDPALVLVFPPATAAVASVPLGGAEAGTGAIRTATLPLRSGAPLSFAASIETLSWRAVLRPPATLSTSSLSYVEIGLEITQSSREADALAFAFVLPPRRRALPGGPFTFGQDVIDFEVGAAN